jgi:hypothetical protein
MIKNKEIQKKAENRMKNSIVFLILTAIIFSGAVYAAAEKTQITPQAKAEKELTAQGKTGFDRVLAINAQNVAYLERVTDNEFYVRVYSLTNNKSSRVSNLPFSYEVPWPAVPDPARKKQVLIFDKNGKLEAAELDYTSGGLSVLCDFPYRIKPDKILAVPGTDWICYSYPTKPDKNCDTFNMDMLDIRTCRVKYLLKNMSCQNPANAGVRPRLEFEFINGHVVIFVETMNPYGVIAGNIIEDNGGTYDNITAMDINRGNAREIWNTRDDKTPLPAGARLVVGAGRVYLNGKPVIETHKIEKMFH